MKASELKKLLAEKGCRFNTPRRQRPPDRHPRQQENAAADAWQKELGTGLVDRILKDLGL